MIPVDIPHLIATGVCAPKGAAPGLHVGWHGYTGFVEFVASLGLRHFSADELLFLGQEHRSGRCGGLNAYPAHSLWPNIAAAITALDALAEELHTCIYILSAYRSPAYNACIAGSDPDSPHTRFSAIDFFCADGNPAKWADRLRAYREEGRFVGGIGIYPLFVHLDADGVARSWS